MKVWTGAAAAVAAVLYVMALSNAVYELTSPVSLSWHVLLRKTYSIGAFALVGYLAGRAAPEWRRRAGPGALALLVAAYSAAIEIGQAFEGSREGLVWNAIDVACGAAGGYLGGLALRLTPPRAPGRRPR
jgi:hypothetical protein